jgi:hypothetical protein
LLPPLHPVALKISVNCGSTGVSDGLAHIVLGRMPVPIHQSHFPIISVAASAQTYAPYGKGKAPPPPVVTKVYRLRNHRRSVNRGLPRCGRNHCVVRAANKQQLAYVYYESEPGRRSATRRSAAKLLNKDEARRSYGAAVKPH